MAEGRPPDLKKLVEKLSSPKVDRGLIHSIDGNRVDVRLLTTSSVVKNVPLVGDPGQMVLGQQVFVYWFARRPVAMAGTSSADAAISVDLEETTTPIGHNVILLLGPSGSVETAFTPNSGGLTAALAASFDGSVVYVSPGSYEDPYTIPYGVHLVGRSKDSVRLVNTVTLSDSATISDITVDIYDTDATEIIGVEGPGGGISTVTNCKILVENYGAGDAKAVRTAGGGKVYLWDCDVYGNASGAGDGYGASSEDGEIYMYFGAADGSTDRFFTAVV